MGAFTLRAPAYGTRATRNILLIKRNECQAERLSSAKHAQARVALPELGFPAVRLSGAMTRRSSRRRHCISAEGAAGRCVPPRRRRELPGSSHTLLILQNICRGRRGTKLVGSTTLMFGAGAPWLTTDATDGCVFHATQVMAMNRSRDEDPRLRSTVDGRRHRHLFIGWSDLPGGFAGPYGVMFWLMWKRLPGSYARLTWTRRS
jgi:hypothetical protein